MKLHLIAICLSVAACNTVTTDEWAAFDRRKTDRLASRDSGKITWSQWARAENADFGAMVVKNGGGTTRLLALMRYREAVAAEVDSGRTTKEMASYLIAQKLSNARDAEERSDAIRSPVTCTTSYSVTTCY